MRCVVQRVSRARVTVAGEVTGEIEKGYMVLVGAGEDDTEADVNYCADKISGLRVFEDDQDKMNLSVQDIGGGILVVSQFTLAADCRNDTLKVCVMIVRTHGYLLTVHFICK